MNADNCRVYTDNGIVYKKYITCMYIDPDTSTTDGKYFITIKTVCGQYNYIECETLKKAQKHMQAIDKTINSPLSK